MRLTALPLLTIYHLIVLELTEEQQRHRVTFYQAALTAFSMQAANGSMTIREKYVMIHNVCVHVQKGETLRSLKRAGYSQVNAWVKKYAVVVSSESSMLVERFVILKHQLKPKPRKACSRKCH